MFLRPNSAAAASSSTATTTPRISLLDAQTGVSTFTIQANGNVLAAQNDGAGGYYVGGDFSCIGPTAQVAVTPARCQSPNTRAYGLVRLRRDGSIDPSFIPVIEGGTELDPLSVTDIARIGSAVYFVGSFWGVSGAFRTGAAAMSDSGELSSWAPRFGDRPSGIEANDNGNLFVFGGPFESVNGQSGGNLVEITLSGEKTGFKASGLSGGLIYDVAQLGAQVFVAGEFLVGSGKKRKKRVAVRLDTTGRLSAWNPTFEGLGSSSYVVLERVGSSVVFGGAFRRAKGKERRGLAAFDESGRLTGWAPRLRGGSAEAFDVASIGATAYVVGSFDRVDSSKRSNAAAIDPDGRPSGWSVPLPRGKRWSPIVAAGQNDVLVVVRRLGDEFLPMEDPEAPVGLPD